MEVVEESERRESRLSAAAVDGPSSRKASGATSALRKVVSPPESSPLSTPRTPASPPSNGQGVFSTITAYEGGGANGSKATESDAAGTAMPAVSSAPAKPQETLFGLAPIAPPHSQTGEAAPLQEGMNDAAAPRPSHVCEVVI